MAERKKVSQKTINKAKALYLDKTEYSAILGLSAGLDKKFRDSFGLPRSPIESLHNDDDWAFVIKMHGFLEAGLNHLLLSELPKLKEVVPKLPTMEGRFGKLTLIRAYKLLPRDACIFVEVLSKIRNAAVHDIKSLDLDLVKYASGLKPEQQKTWRKGLSCWIGKQSAATRNVSELSPRHAIFSCCISIMARALVHRLKSDAQKDLLNKLGEFWIYKRTTYVPVKANPRKR